MGGQIDDLYKTLIRFSKDFQRMNEYFNIDEDIEDNKFMFSPPKKVMSDVNMFKKNEELFYEIDDHQDDGNEEEKNEEVIVKAKAVKYNTIQEIVAVKNKFYDPVYANKRTELPVKRKNLNINVWSILKDAVGKDLSKFCVPGKIKLI
jgi:hypothetical protein